MTCVTPIGMHWRGDHDGETALRPASNVCRKPQVSFMILADPLESQRFKYSYTISISGCRVALKSGHPQIVLCGDSIAAPGNARPGLFRPHEDGWAVASAFTRLTRPIRRRRAVNAIDRPFCARRPTLRCTHHSLVSYKAGWRYSIIFSAT